MINDLARAGKQLLRRDAATFVRMKPRKVSLADGKALATLRP